MRRCPQKNKRKMPKRTARWWTHERMDFDFDRRVLCSCASVPQTHFPPKKEREKRQNLKNSKKKPNTSLKRDTPRQNLSLQNDSNTRARIKQQQQEQQRRGGRSFENERKRARTIILVFFRRGGGKREDGFVVYFFVRFYDENHVDARKSPKSSREI